MTFARVIPLFLIGVAIALAAPKPPENVVFKPTFLTGNDSLTAGTGFVLSLGVETVFVTAHHLFGPAAGLEREFTPGGSEEIRRGAGGHLHEPEPSVGDLVRDAADSIGESVRRS